MHRATPALPKPSPARRAQVLLACFALSLLVAMAAPLVRAPQWERLCTASHEALWVLTDSGDAPVDDAHALQCALCLPPLLTPPPLQTWHAPTLAAFAFIAEPALALHRAPLSRAPFPPRAPPAAGARFV